MNSQNQLSPSLGCVYDSAGNMTTGTGGAGYAYNAENQMTSTANVNYVYDGDGRRVQKSNGKLYWYGMGGEVLDETDLTGSTTNSSFNEYVFFGGKRIARRDSSGNVFYYFADHLGTSRAIAEIPSGQNTATRCYDADFYPFGGERSPIVNNCSQNYKFTGKERDSESGLDNFAARYNSSSIGRFMSPDPLGGHLEDPQTLNRYAYVRNNPLNLTDPTGLDSYLSCSASVGGHSTWSVGRCTQTNVGEKHGWLWKLGHALGIVQTEEEKKAELEQEKAAAAAYERRKTAWEKQHPGRSYAWHIFNLQMQMTPMAGLSIEGEGAEAAVELTEHAAARLAQRGITQAAVDEAIATAKAAGQVTSRIGKYGTVQNIYKGANGITVVMETEGRNAGKVITVFETGSKP